jgi:TRAP-type C4-dicarboxylate transport system substrate-binding protein
MLLIAKPLFDSLTPEQQAIIKEAAQEAALYQREVCDRMENDFINELRESGMEITMPDIIPFQEASLRVYDEFRGEIGDAAELLDRIIAIGRQES